VTKRLLLDTHVALWLDGGDERLRASTRLLIDSCWQNSGAIFLSAITAWEIVSVRFKSWNLPLFS